MKKRKQAYRRLGLVGVLLLIGSTMTTGCFDRSELEEQAFLVTMGIDQKSKQTPVNLIARVAIPSKLSGSSGGGGGSADFQSGTPVVTAQGRTIHEALSMMNTGVERTINLSHVAAVMFSERAAKQGLLQYMRTLVRYREFRRTLYLFVTQGSIGDIFLKDHPVLETSATRVIEDLHESSMRTGFAPSINLHQFLGNLETPNEDPILPILAYNKQVGKEKKKTEGDPKHLHTDEVSFAPGQINRAGGNPIECVGTALFRGDRMVGELSGRDTRYMQLLSATSNRITVNIPEPLGGSGFVTVGIRYAEPIHVDLVLRGKHPKLTIYQSFESELIGDQTSTSYVEPAPKRILEKKLSAFVNAQETKLVHTLFSKYKVDPFHFFGYARGQFSTFTQMEHYNWRKELPVVEVKIVTEVTLRRLGTQLNPPVVIDAELEKLGRSTDPASDRSQNRSAGSGKDTAQKSGIAHNQSQ